MAQPLPSPPLSRSASPAPAPGSLQQHSEERIVDQLDVLLTQYLELLDSYTKLRDDLSRQFSEGFFALAKAQRASNMGAGRRYDQDGYDRRMKALRRIEIRQSSKGTAITEGITLDCQMIEHLSLRRIADSTTDRTPSIENKGDPSPNGKQADNDQAATKPDPAYRDPATWYGLLVPMPLKMTQQQFAQALQTSIPQLVTTKSSLESLEKQIWETRASLGIEDQYETAQGAEKSTSDTVAQVDLLLAQAKSTSRP